MKRDIIIFHGVVSRINYIEDKDYLWFDLKKDNYYYDKEGKLRNNPFFFTARIKKELSNRINLEIDQEIRVKGIPSGYTDSKGKRQNFIQVTSINETNLNITVMEKFKEEDGKEYWNGVELKKIPLTKEEQKEMEDLLKEFTEDKNEC